MAPLPASSDIHTDSWGNHRMGNFSIPVVVGFLTDMWGSHRGVAASATDREGIRRRSPAPENEQNSWRPLTTVLAIVPVWWYLIIAFSMLFFILLSWVACTRWLKYVKHKKGQKLELKEASTRNKKVEDYGGDIKGREEI